ncbi:hypothetical protein CPB85DRAFT_754190 [Mucidula mucida]|nr:hypothetical protein CPB85DRAFT_754190 [Mucidula mucida]
MPSAKPSRKTNDAEYMDVETDASQEVVEVQDPKKRGPKAAKGKQRATGSDNEGGSKKATRKPTKAKAVNADSDDEPTSAKKPSRSLQSANELAIAFAQVEMNIMETRTEMLREEKELEAAKQETIRLEREKSIAIEASKKETLEAEHALETAKQNTVNKEIELAKTRGTAPSSPDRLHKKAKLSDITNTRTTTVALNPEQLARRALMSAALLNSQTLTLEAIDKCLQYSKLSAVSIDTAENAAYILREALSPDVEMSVV